MVLVGEIEYRAKVVGADTARSKTEDLQESQEDLADTSESSASALNGFAGTVRRSGNRSKETGRQTGILTHSLRILGSTGAFVGGTLLGLAKTNAFLAASIKGVTVAVGLLKAGMGALAIGGIAGKVVFGLKVLAGVLLGAAAAKFILIGALAVGIGLLGAWMLHTTGALDRIRDFGAYVGGELPDAARDGLLQVLSLIAGPLAVLGGFIIGTFEGGFSEGFARAREVTGVFVGAWGRQIGRVRDTADDAWVYIGNGVGNLKDRTVGYFGDIATRGRRSWRRLTDGARNMTSRITGFFGEIRSAATFGVRSGFNAVVPPRVNIPSVTLRAPDWAGGMRHRIGGGSIPLPRLQVGGMVEDTGAAVVHRGEAVIPRPIVEAAQRGTSGGGGDSITNVERLAVYIEGGDFDPADMTRREIEDFAERIADALGKKTSTVAGTR